MREIKFRIWCISTKQIMYLEGPKINFEYGLFAWDSDTGICGLPSDDIHDYEVMEYTGLKDKNGREVFEGDIIQYVGAPYDPLWRSGPVAVKWEEFGDWCIEGVGYTIGGSSKDDTDRREVIGNIWENPDLLRG